MKSEELKKRTKAFALQIIKFVEPLPRTRAIDVISRQVLRSATSIAANYRSACRARSQADFISKIGITEEESDETLLWLELLCESGLVRDDRNKESLKTLMIEANELTAIFAASGRTAKGKKTNPKSAIQNH